jgi:hypothetical protein
VGADPPTHTTPIEVHVIVRAEPSLMPKRTESPLPKLLAVGVLLAPKVHICIEPFAGLMSTDAPSEIVNTSSRIVPSITGFDKVLLVRVCVSSVPTTTPDGIAFCAAEPSMLPELFDTTKLLAAIPLNVLLSTEIVLFVSVVASESK